jgi:hypothetical protein
MYLLTTAARLLIPGLRTQQKVYILHLFVPPNRLVRTRPHRLERIVRIRQRNPPSPKCIAQQRLIREIIVHGTWIGQALEDQVVYFCAGIHDLEAAVGHAEAEIRGCASRLRFLGIAVLRGKSAVLGHPVLGVVWFLKWIAHTRVACCEDAISFTGHGRGVEFEVHEFVHVLKGHHVAVELDDAVVFGEGEGREFGPAVVEARVVGVVFVDCGQQVFDVLLGDGARVEGGVAGGREGVGVQGNEGVFAAVFLEGVVECEEAGEVGCVGDEGCPYWSL